MKIFKNNTQGNLHIVNYVDENKLHREDGPAVVEFIDGKIVKEMYYYKGLLHRNNGPAVINYDKNGNETLTYNYKHGVFMTSTMDLEVLWS